MDEKKEINKTEGEAKQPPKKKKFIQVYRPQNATSKEGKDFTKHGQTAQKEKAKKEAARAAERKNAKLSKEESVRTKAAGDGAAVSRKAAQEKPAEMKAAETKAVETKTVETNAVETEAVETRAVQTKTAEAKGAETGTVQTKAVQTKAAEAKAVETGAVRTEPAESRIRETKPAESVKPAERSERQGKGTGDRSQSDRTGRGTGDRPQSDRTGRGTGDRLQGDRTGRGTGDRSQGDRTGRGTGDRPQGDRAQRGTGDRAGRGTGGRPQGDRTQRSYGDRPQGDRQPRGYGDRRPADKDGERTAHDTRKVRGDRRPAAAPAMDIGMKKPSRDAGHKDKNKDKNKDQLRKNKFTNDRETGSNRPNQGKKQMHNIPKALQKSTHNKAEEKKEVVKEITIPEKLTIRELAEKMKMQPSVIVKKLFLEGTMVTVNQEIDYEKAAEIALGFDILAEQEEKVDVIEELLREAEENEEEMIARPPVVCVMGHVDHGKTSLLDAIRDTHVTDREAGGITQHIGAYVVTINGQKITFLDTPGHEAFTAMRMRGANSTDIAILVVAADDGVMPQTVEAINHAKAAGVEILVAINKIDKPGANVDRVKQELTEYELIPEDWGGSTVFVPVSAKTHEGIDNLLEMILLTAEVMELKANPNRAARGLVLEAKLDKGKGPVANVLIQKGTLRLGDYIAAGACSGKVRAMMDEQSRRLKEAGPSTPVEILGLNDVPNAGEIIVSTATDKEAKNFAATFVSENKNRLIAETKSKMSLDDLFNQIQEGNLKELNILVKADVQGSVEAVRQSLLKLSNEEVVVKIIHGGVGAINESDVTLAAASNAIIIGFNVRPDVTAKAIAEQEGVDVRLYKVIYQAIEDVEAAMKGMLDPVFEEQVIGHAEIRQIFRASGVGNIAGSYVLDGIFKRDCKVRITREGEQIYEGALASLKRFKDDVKEVRAGYECGLVFEDFNEIQELDQVEAYVMVEVPR